MSVCGDGSRMNFQAHLFGFLYVKKKTQPNRYNQRWFVQNDVFWSLFLYFSTSSYALIPPSIHCTRSLFLRQYDSHQFLFSFLSNRLLITSTQFHWQVADSRENHRSHLTICCENDQSNIECHHTYGMVGWRFSINLLEMGIFRMRGDEVDGVNENVIEHPSY